MQLTGRTIYQCFVQLLNSTCFKCLGFISNSSDITKLDCECRICKRCLNIMIIDSTDGKNIINSYERSRILI